ncbi:MAG TPA: hypothetical protein VH092_14800 [Urbifossiella sp.]|jgi:hypothetical protein|nr:hypothetical protein [Urbifossiella sp.]
MTPTTTATRTALTSQTSEAGQLLRDAAYVLKLTRRVKAEIVRDAAGPRTPLDIAIERAAAALGV